jgi:ABC-type sulfate transport system permease component
MQELRELRQDVKAHRQETKLDMRDVVLRLNAMQTDFLKEVQVLRAYNAAIEKDVAVHKTKIGIFTAGIAAGISMVFGGLVAYVVAQFTRG